MADSADRGGARSGSSGRAYVAQAYRCHASELKRFLQRHLRSSSDAEDFSQEIWLRLHDATIESLEHARAFVFHVAWRLVVDENRRRRVRGAGSMIDPQQLVDTLPGCEDVLLAQERWNDVWRVARGLPVRRRRVFFMHKLRDLSHKEIAHRLGISTHTVERHIVRAMAHYRASSDYGPVSDSTRSASFAQ